MLDSFTPRFFITNKQAAMIDTAATAISGAVSCEVVVLVVVQLVVVVVPPDVVVVTAVPDIVTVISGDHEKAPN